MKRQILVGAHMSIALGLDKALYEGQKIGANVIQIFTANQRSWREKNLSQKEIDLFKKAKKETQISYIMSHNSYLINLGSFETELLQKSRKAFKEEILRCHALEIDYLTFHPGSSKTNTEDQCLKKIVESLLFLKTIIKKGKTKLLLETTAGQGTSVGYKFEHLGYIIKKTKLPLGVCFDTCHSFAAGYDIRTKKAWDTTLKEFDKKIGLKHLLAFHVNDSMHDLGSRKDRHASLGKGKIGIESFKYLMKNPKTKHIPKYLETPLGEKMWEDEIKLLKKFGEK